MLREYQTRDHLSVISGVTKTIGELGLAGPGKYATLFVAIGCVPLLAAAAGWLWPRETLQH